MSRAGQALTMIRQTVNRTVAFQTAAFLIATICFYAANIAVLLSPSTPLHTTQPHPATLLLNPHIKTTPIGSYLILNGNFWIPITANPAIPDTLFIIGTLTLTSALALDLHPTTAPNWYGILKAKHPVEKVHQALTKTMTNKRFLITTSTIQTASATLTITAFYHYAVGYLVNGGLQWEIPLTPTIHINVIIPAALAAALILTNKIAIYKKIGKHLTTQQK